MRRTILKLAMLFSLPVAVQAQTLTVLHSFTGSPNDGWSPSARPTLDQANNLYGTTEGGGSYCNPGGGCGTVYEMTASGSFLVLHSFGGPGGKFGDGILPYAGVTRDSRGNLYGTTLTGGYQNKTYCFDVTCGMVYAVAPTGREMIMYQFAGLGGANSQTGVLRDGKGNLYGTTTWGGASYDGVVYEISGGKEILLHTFTGGTTDGYRPMSGVLMDSAGNLYGTTLYGGSANCGVVFKIDAAAKAYSIFHQFAGTPGGCWPANLLWNSASGAFYGVTGGGGANNVGSLFKLDSSGNETTLFSFSELQPAGVSSTLTMDSAGNFYDTTIGGGSFEYGSVFKVDSSGNYTVLYSFTGGADGAAPYAGVSIDKAGANLYGTTFGGGSADGGVLFKLSLQ